MPIIATDLRNTKESAKLTRFESVSPFTATNVQDAIQQSTTFPTITATTSVVPAMSPYVPLASDTVLLVNTNAGPVTIAMPPSVSRAGLDLEIKDVANSAAGNPITVTFAVGENADGLSPYPIDSNSADVRFGPRPTGGYFVRS